MAPAVNPRPYDATQRRRLAQQQRQQSRERVVTAAAALFAQSGYTATTIDAIAQAAGVAVQTAYSAGGGKPSLMLAGGSRAAAGRGGPTPPPAPQRGPRRGTGTAPRRPVPTP